MDGDSRAVVGEDVFDGFAPFDYDVVVVFDVLGEVAEHKAGVGEAIKIVVSKSVAVGSGVRFGNSKTRAGDFVGDAEAGGEAASEGSLAGANVADKFDDRRC